MGSLDFLIPGVLWVLIASGRRAKLAIYHRHATQGAVEERDADVKNPFRPAGGAGDLKREEPHFGFAFGARRGKEEIANEDANGADEGVAQPRRRVYLDHDSGVFFVEELVVDAEQEFLVPPGIGVAVSVDTCQQSALRVEPRDGVRLHRLGQRLQVLRRDQIYLQKLERHNVDHADDNNKNGGGGREDANMRRGEKVFDGFS